MGYQVGPENEGLINQKPRPRLLIKGFDDQPDLRESLRGLTPTSRTISHFSEVRQEEWDIVVTDECLREKAEHNIASWADHICIIYSGENWTIEATKAGTIYGSNGYISQELKRVRGLPTRIADLTHEQLEPVLISRERHRIFGVQKPLGSRAALMNENDEATPQQEALAIEPFICTASGEVLAGRYKRSARSEAWLIPPDVPDLVPWVRTALAEWHTLAPDRFPGIPDWAQLPEWMTPNEQALKDALEELKREREGLIARLEARELEARQELRQAKDSADLYERALLTTQSDSLKIAVMKALSELGFTVVDADLEAEPGDHLEDLQVSDSDRPGWIALVEVKGYTRGAATTAFAQFTRFNKRYVQKHHVNPDASWYIANQFLGRDPAERQPILHGKAKDVKSFAESDGLVIDTVELFKLLRTVQNGALTAADARSKLRLATGIFKNE